MQLTSPWTRRAYCALLWAWIALLCPALGWAQTLESVLSPGPLTQVHAKAENDCSNCHVRFNPRGQDAQCLACHKAVAVDVAQRRGFHGRNPADAACRSCHTDHKGRNAKIVRWDTQRFDHRQTDYPLSGKHQTVACEQCHVPAKKYRDASSSCDACHRKDDAHKGGLGAKCESCHTPKTWKEASFDHGKQTHFALQDKHESVKCDACHQNGHFKDTPRACAACHKKDDAHKGRFGERCDSCHDAKSWETSTFSHDRDTDFMLRGKHRNVECKSCHIGASLKERLGRTCWDCHQKDDKHKESLGRDCASCHSELGWKNPPRFDHGKTRFPLLGQHDKVECNSCHTSPAFKGTPVDCVACHKKDDKHENTLGAQCETCHSAQNWKNTSGRFDHDKTHFPLRSAHAAHKVKCGDCHADAQHLRGTPTACVSCHKKDDKHEGSLGRQCDQCHNDQDWKAGGFDHARTRFPLTGSHFRVTCDACHATKRFKDASRDCAACHTKDDVHRQTLGRACETCHNTRTWRSWDFDHNIPGRFALNGAHQRLACVSCHKKEAPPGRTIAPVSSACVDCHAMQDPHDGQFGSACERCHNVSNWKQIRNLNGGG